MKEVFVPEKFNLVKNVEKLQGKLTFKQFISKRLPESLGILVGTVISAILCNGVNIMSVLCIGTYTGLLILNEKYKNREMAKKNLDHSMLVDGYTDLLDDFELEDCKNAVIHNRKPKDECWWLMDGMGKVDNRKVVSYIAIPKKCKLIVFKQILNQYRYENPDIKDTCYTQMFLLEEDDLIKERIITSDGYLNERNALGKKLINSNFYK